MGAVATGVIAIIVGTLVGLVLQRPRSRLGSSSVVPLMSIFLMEAALFIVCLGLTARPLLSGAATMVIIVGVVLISNAKHATLREPLVVTDFALARQVYHYPSFYIAYVGLWRIVISVIVPVLIGALMIWAEAPLISWQQTNGVLTSMGLVAIGLLVLLGVPFVLASWPGFLSFARPTWDPIEDASAFGIVAALMVQWVGIRCLSPLDLDSQGETASAQSPKPADLPHLVLVESESFFDPRSLDQDIDPEHLSGFDDVIAQSLQYGKMPVEIWGANTMRTEFTILTGLARRALGPHWLNPYLTLVDASTPSLVKRLKALGYRCVCVHPFYADFFERDRVFKNLGFDEFLDISWFEDDHRHGPHVSDPALGRAVVDLLTKTDQPTFVFAITIENHGQWAEDRFDENPAPEPGSPELKVPNWADYRFRHYLRHLKSADRMIEETTKALQNLSHPVVFSLFGDHQPPLPEVFEQTDYTDISTDYFIWASEPGAGQGQCQLRPEDLGNRLYDLVIRNR